MKDQPAFPITGIEIKHSEATGLFHEIPFTKPGLTKRELFAAMAMQSIIRKLPLDTDMPVGISEKESNAARGALDYADALIAELERK